MSPEMDFPVMASHQLDTEFCADGGLVNERRENPDAPHPNTTGNNIGKA